MIAFAFALSLIAQTPAASVTTSNAWLRLPPPGAPTAAAFLTLTNTTKSDRKLVAVEARNDKIAKTIELHTHLHENGVMKMRKVDAIDVKAGAVVVLAPGGLHVMLIGLVTPPIETQRVPLRLRFDDGSILDVDVPVLRDAPKPL